MGRVRNAISGKILKPYLSNCGYYIVKLSKDGKAVGYLVHRLVAEAFIPNPDSLPCVNHKSEIKTENFVENLEWCDRIYNANYGSAINRRIIQQEKPLIAFNNEHKIGTYFTGLSDAAHNLNVTKPAIWNVLKGLRKRVKGFTLEYV